MKLIPVAVLEGKVAEANIFNENGVEVNYKGIPNAVHTIPVFQFTIPRSIFKEFTKIDLTRVRIKKRLFRLKIPKLDEYRISPENLYEITGFILLPNLFFVKSFRFHPNFLH